MNYIISRHNKAVVLIQEAIASGSSSGCDTIMNAIARDNLPPGVADTHVPQWLLPLVPAETRSLLRPDLLLTKGMPASMPTDSDLLDPAVRAQVQASCTINVLEVGYTSDSSLTSAGARKRAQHVQLCARLRAAGWLLSPGVACPFLIILLALLATSSLRP